MQIDPDDDAGDGGEVVEHLDGLRRLGLAAPVPRRSLNDRLGGVRELGGEVSLEDASVATSTRAKYRTGWIDWCAAGSRTSATVTSR